MKKAKPKPIFFKRNAESTSSFGDNISFVKLPYISVRIESREKYSRRYFGCSVYRSSWSSIGISHICYIRSGDFHLLVVPTTKILQFIPTEFKAHSWKNVWSHPLATRCQSLLPNFWYIEKMPRIEFVLSAGIYSFGFRHKSFTLPNIR